MKLYPDQTALCSLREQFCPEVIKLFMLNSTEHEVYPAHKCLNGNNCWHFNIY